MEGLPDCLDGHGDPARPRAVRRPLWAAGDRPTVVLRRRSIAGLVLVSIFFIFPLFELLTSSENSFRFQMQVKDGGRRSREKVDVGAGGDQRAEDDGTDDWVSYFRFDLYFEKYTHH
eukprot:680553_1